MAIAWRFVQPAQPADDEAGIGDEWQDPTTGIVTEGMAVGPQVWNVVGEVDNLTGSGSAALGSNCPAVTVSAPYTWIKTVSKDGSTVYIPVWK